MKNVGFRYFASLGKHPTSASLCREHSRLCNRNNKVEEGKKASEVGRLFFPVTLDKAIWINHQ